MNSPFAVCGHCFYCHSCNGCACSISCLCGVILSVICEHILSQLLSSIFNYIVLVFERRSLRSPVSSSLMAL